MNAEILFSNKGKEVRVRGEALAAIGSLHREREARNNKHIQKKKREDHRAQQINIAFNFVRQS